MERPSDENVSRLPTRPEPRGESFYAVGGPVQPGRGCYIERAADRQLYTKLVAGEYCHVLAPRQSGKSSLVARTARKLRAEGFLTAVVDLSQMSTKDGSSEAGRWYYTVAYRIVRELAHADKVIAVENGHDVCLFHLPTACLRSLTFGVRFDRKRRSALARRIAKSKQLQHIALEQTKLDPQRFALGFEAL